MAKKISVGGHRGMGCTDHDFYQSRRDIARLPVENTVESVEAAFAAGCDYVEIDAVMSADGVIFTLHNVVPGDHFFGVDKPAAPLNQLMFDEIKRFGSGRSGKGRIVPLADMLTVIAGLDPKTLPFAVNIEIKGVQGAGQPLEQNDFIKNLAAVVMASPLPERRVLFSSFALHNVMTMSHELPRARYGLLFGEKPDARPIYADRQQSASCQYLPYDSAHVGMAMALWQNGAATGTELGYFHPEFQTIGADGVALADRHDKGLNTWALFEEMTAERRVAYTRLADACQAEDVELTVITDYIAAFG